MRRLALLLVSSALLVPPAAAAPGVPDGDPCAIPPAERPPDPRCGESIDGRAEARPSVGLTAARVALAPPRLATTAVLWPVVKASDAVEHHQLWDRMRAALTTDDGLVGIRPVLHYTSGFAPTGGARAYYRRLPGPGSEVSGLFQTAGPDIFVGKLALRGPDWLGLSLSGSFNRRNDRLFAGIGPNSERELVASGHSLARYASDNVEATLRWTRALPARLFVGVHSEVRRQLYDAEVRKVGYSVSDFFAMSPEACAAQGLGPGCVDEAHLPGFRHGLRVGELGGNLMLNTRGPARDASGIVMAVSGAYVHGVTGDPSRHGTFGAETAVAVGGRDKVFILRGRAAMVERLGDAPIPFAELVTPSGRTGMRGFAEGRFRGESGLVGTAEYRWYISTYLDATLFVDVGTVAGPRFAGLDWQRWFPSYGVGLRFHDPRPVYWESPVVDGIQVAYSPEAGVRFLLALAAF